MDRLVDMLEVYEERRRRILQEQGGEETVEEEPKKSSRRHEPDDFGEDPDGGAFFESESEEEDEEFRGAPADPEMSDGFGEQPGDDYGVPQFGDIPEPSTEPDDALWHSNVGWNDDETGSPSEKHRTRVEFPEREEDEEGE